MNDLIILRVIEAEKLVFSLALKDCLQRLNLLPLTLDAAHQCFVLNQKRWSGHFYSSTISNKFQNFKICNFSKIQ